MEPATGASTCALGSQRCAPYRGILTRKARRQPVHQSLLAKDGERAMFENWRVSSESEPVVF